MYMKKFKQILAIIGIILLVGLYVAAFVLSFMHSPLASRWFSAAIYSTIIIPIFLWLVIMITKYLKNLNK